jgi:hypothetical protein
LAGASALVTAAGSTSLVRTTKKIEWVVVNKARDNMLIFTKKELTRLVALTERHLTESDVVALKGVKFRRSGMEGG